MSDAREGEGDPTARADGAGATPPGAVRGRRVRLATGLTARPLVTTAGLALIVGAINVWWVLRYRDPGAYTSDEAGYIAKALLYHRGLTVGPSDFLGEVFSASHTGILVPLVSVPFLLAGPSTEETAMLAQPAIAGIAAVASAGVVNRIAGRGAALVAGMVMLCLPAVINSARNYQYATAVGACLLLAMWTLLLSDRGHRRWPMVAFGAAVGAMMLTRTMAVAFIPAVSLGALVYVRRDRRSLLNLGLAALTSSAVAVPWWYRSRQPISNYLLRAGYGDQAGDYGSGGIGARTINRLLAGLGDARLPFTILGVVAVTAVVVHLVRWRSSGKLLRSWPGASRALGPMAAVVLGGYLALLSTSTRGVWFELPLEMVAVTMVVALVARVGGRWARVAATTAVVLSVVTLAVSLGDRGGALELDQPRQLVVASFSGGLIDRGEVLGQADARLLSNDRATRARAAREWWAVHADLVATIEDLRRDDQRPVVTVAGNSHLLNEHSLLLAYVLNGSRPPPIEAADTRLPDDRLRTSVEPRRGRERRVLVLMEPRSEPFHADHEVGRLRALADDGGWLVDETLELPDGGRATVMAHPSG